MNPFWWLWRWCAAAVYAVRGWIDSIREWNEVDERERRGG